MSRKPDPICRWAAEWTLTEFKKALYEAEKEFIRHEISRHENQDRTPRDIKREAWRLAGEQFGFSVHWPEVKK